MNKNKIIASITKIKEAVDTVGFNDHKAWQTISNDFDALLNEVPKDVKQLFELIINGLVNATCSMSHIDAIYDALDSAEQYIKTPGTNTEMLQEAHQKLVEIHKEEGRNVLEGGSLDDAAALLIQIDPEDTQEIVDLQTLLKNLPHADLVPETNAILEQSISLLNNPASETLMEVGKLIEQAIYLNEIQETTCDNHNYMPQNAETELIEAFITESLDLIADAEDAMLALETDPEDTEAIAKIFRAFHTVKGTSTFLELNLIAEIGHHAESLLSRVRDAEIRYSGGYADLSLQTLDMLKILILSVQDGLQGKPLFKPEGYDELFHILQDPEKNGISADDNEEPDVRVGDILVARDKIERQAMEDIAEEQHGLPIGSAIVKSDKGTNVTNVAQALRTQKRIQSNSSKSTTESSVRVPIERLDRFVDMVGELVVNHSMVSQDEIVLKHHELQKKVSITAKIVRELQNMSMAMRMVPLKETFRKMTRLVRDLSKRIGKKITFITEGEETEIDRNMVNIINDPLMHLVRNAVDHGIETPEIRESMNKEPHGTIHLCAYHAAGNVVVEIRDNGKGLDREAIIAKAIEKGLVKNDLIKDGEDEDIYNLIFEAGFSTTETVSDISGRGVGMDVVKRNLEDVNGQIEIKSTPGAGSIFKLSLPLTLAIIDGMVVKVGGQRYVIPTISIVRSVQPKSGDINTVLNRGEMMQLPDRLLPIIRLAQLFEIEDDHPDLIGAIIVIVEYDNKQAGLLIDELIGSQQIVIKTMGEALGNIPGISGSAIMPDGRVGLILDVGGLVKLANMTSRNKY